MSGGDEPGLLPIAGTMPTIPDTTGDAAPESIAEPALPAAEPGTTEADVFDAAPWVLISDAATVASGFPLGSTNITSPVEVAAFLCPFPPPR